MLKKLPVKTRDTNPAPAFLFHNLPFLKAWAWQAADCGLSTLLEKALGQPCCEVMGASGPEQNLFMSLLLPCTWPRALQNFINWRRGNSLVVRWLGLHASTTGAQVWSLVRELGSCKPLNMAKGKKSNWKTKIYKIIVSENRLVVSNCLWPPWTIQSMKFSRPGHWSGSLFPSPEKSNIKLKVNIIKLY